MILTAQPGGVRIANRVREALSAPLGAPSAPAYAWCALQCLPYAVSSPKDLEALAEPLLSRVPPTAPEPLLLLLSEAVSILAAARAARKDLDALRSLANTGLAAVRGRPASFHALLCARVALEALRRASKGGKGEEGEGEAMLGEKRGLEVLRMVEANLDHPAQSMRRETLRLLCCFDAPAGSSALQRLADIESGASTLEQGRRSASSLTHLRADLEYKRVPDALRGAVARSLYGLLHVRFSVLWKPTTEALAMAVAVGGDEAWECLLRHVGTAQRGVLEGRVGDGGAAMEALQVQVRSEAGLGRRWGLSGSAGALGERRCG